MDGLSQYGPWAVAFGLLLVTGKELIVAMLSNKRDSSTPLADLARAVEKLSAVLERLERSQDKALTEIQVSQREMLILLTEIRTKGGRA